MAEALQRVCNDKRETLAKSEQRTITLGRFVRPKNVPPRARADRKAGRADGRGKVWLTHLTNGFLERRLRGLALACSLDSLYNMLLTLSSEGAEKDANPHIAGRSCTCAGRPGCVACDWSHLTTKVTKK